MLIISVKVKYISKTCFYISFTGGFTGEDQLADLTPKSDTILGTICTRAIEVTLLTKRVSIGSTHPRSNHRATCIKELHPFSVYNG